ncbi:MAG: hypothetical protein A3G81_28185 [Betaproteobacteria bacterium RIFCSPLOWO2_12_FULL_65_14]|nr:MAG: hypothetical protein A3G81_28185 [Betaproteobacteria bacterium RIFCSPLOWO2_12_FULL_65_14]
MRDRYAVVGNPVAHSKSPWIHAEFARATGQQLEYGRIEALLDGFERARAAQAVNTLVFNDDVFGDNTDGVGLVTDIEQNLGFKLKDKQVLLMGAGGAAQGVVRSLLDAGVGRLVIANRTVSKAEALAQRFPGVRACGYEALSGERFDLAVNATSAGLAGESPRLPRGVLRPGMLAYDMVYGRDTPFLAAARAAGARACNGLGMLVEQAAESFFLWRGVRPDTRSVLERLRAAR